mmetsp:Transcript_9135/g.22413  ORF Transcript_9135/g.22413 Transcript_9135/m.22413 type:complete len:334 (-) Transcript_9135:570-1571(-)
MQLNDDTDGMNGSHPMRRAQPNWIKITVQSTKHASSHSHTYTVSPLISCSRHQLGLLVELLQLLLLVGIDARGHKVLQVAAQELVEREVPLEAMVGHTSVLVVVGADLLGPRPGAHLHLPQGSDLLLLTLQLHRIELRPQHLQGGLLVLQLRPLLLAEDANAGGFVEEVDGGLDLVDILPTRPAGPSRLELDVIHVELHAHIIRLRHDGHGRGGRVDAALSLGDGNTLHPVHPRLEFEFAVDLVALHLHHGWLLRYDLAPPPLVTGILLVHPQQVLCPYAGLVAARARPDLHDDVLVVVRIRRQQQYLEFLLELWYPFRELIQLHLHQLTHLT